MAPLPIWNWHWTNGWKSPWEKWWMSPTILCKVGRPQPHSQLNPYGCNQRTAPRGLTFLQALEPLSFESRMEMVIREHLKVAKYWNHNVGLFVHKCWHEQCHFNINTVFFFGDLYFFLNAWTEQVDVLICNCFMWRIQSRDDAWFKGRRCFFTPFKVRKFCTHVFYMSISQWVCVFWLRVYDEIFFTVAKYIRESILCHAAFCSTCQVFWS